LQYNAGLHAANNGRAVAGVVMSIEAFESISLYVGIGGLVLFMVFIIWDLAKKSNAGKFGTAILFVVLGLCMLGFVIKTILVQTLD
jgi:hypothetical protein|tara:strand:- start:1166 stop:1423 length:258 start_codon:yes stop_codon:yes gene_type:complete